jgi:hypothetical protein
MKFSARSRNIALVSSGLLATLGAQAATFNLSGNYRFGTNMYSNQDLASGKRSGAGNGLTFLEHRILLSPDVLIDERFTVKLDLNMAQTSLPPGSKNTVPTHFGTPLDTRLGASGGQLMQVSAAYLQWSSDWGVFRFGRAPKTWGLGLLYDGGQHPLDDFRTVTDRADFQAMLGNLGLRLAFEKGAEGLIASDADDTDTYEVAIDYANPEASSNVGIMYSRSVRSGTAKKSSHDLSIFAKKTWGKVELGGEFVSLSEKDANPANGFLGQFDWKPGAFSFGLDFGYASSSSDSTFVFHPNYRPFMLLYRQSLGPAVPVGTIRGGAAGGGVGADVASSGGGGATLFKGNMMYDFGNQDLVLGTDFGFASLARKGSASSSTLGFETDLYLIQKWYENFKTHYALGMLFPGEAFGSNAQVGWGLEIKGVLQF